MKGHAKKMRGTILRSPWIRHQKFQHPVWMIIKLRKMMSEEWATWHMYVRQLHQHANTSNTSVDQTYYGQPVH